MKTIFCLAYIDKAGTGVDQFDTAQDRANRLGKTGGVDEKTFEVSVPVDANADDIEDAIDAVWTTVRGDQSPEQLASAMKRAAALPAATR